ncbi:OprO/OprP family phosphate-selective porin, partial [bacterium]|nr:OprO/OprP family phosphate-selective porin [bacterium]
MKLMLGLMVVILFVAVIVPQNAVAQAGGAFYAEEMKEGRIYVFNDPKAYQLFKDSGELEVRITRIGAGPNGETIYFDSENAIHMYNFKHDLPAEVIVKPEEKKPVMKVSWKDGKTTIETDLATLIISNRIQVRYTDSEVLPAILAPGIGSGDSIGSFRIRRAKTKFEGWFYQKWMTYEVQLNWADVLSSLEDANLNIDVSRGKNLFMIKSGQFKVPFGRQELTSSGSQEFVDRALVSNLFARGRDIGVQVWGTPFGGKVDWRVGVFNGNGRNVTINDNADYQVDARVTFQPWGDVKYSEGDFESTDKPLFAVAAEYEQTEQSGAATSTTSAFRRELETFGFDAVFKYKGLFAFYDFYQRTTDDVISGSSIDLGGYNIQVGYFIIRNKFEVAGRYATI